MSALAGCCHEARRVRVVAIVGPTAVGKTEASLRLARDVGGEIISADSRQIYRYMDIGTAKPSAEERAAVPHHLVDAVRPDEVLTLAQYRALARAAIADVWARGALPILVGGTGLYVKALLDGWTIPEVPPDPALRAALQTEADRDGPAALHARLAAVDAQAAERIDSHNVRRVIRALEIYQHTGRPPSELQRKAPPDYATLRIGLTMPREALYRRIDARVDAMMAAGLVREVQDLVARGYTWGLPAMSGLGYRQIGQYLRGEISLSEAVALIKRHTRRFVRQQYNWFRLDDPTIVWYNTCDDIAGPLAARVRSFLAEP